MRRYKKFCEEHLIGLLIMLVCPGKPLYHHLLKFWTLETIWIFVCTCGCVLPYRIALTLSDTHSSPISKAMVFVKVIGLQWLKWNPDHGIHVSHLIESCHDSLLVMWQNLLSYLCYKICYVYRLMLSNRNLLLGKGRSENCVTPLCQRKFIPKHTFRNAWEFHVPVDILCLSQNKSTFNWYVHPDFCQSL
jgi:hypothetical protein